jgi:hypothetical protein
MLQLTILNDGTGTDESANYTFHVGVTQVLPNGTIGDETIAEGTVTGHNRADGWRVLALEAIAPGMLGACEQVRTWGIELASAQPEEREALFARLWPHINDTLRAAIRAVEEE